MTEIDHKTYDVPCVIERGMRLIGGRWKGTILWQLREEPQRFNVLNRKIVGTSKSMLSRRLDELEADNLIMREVICEKPIAVRYHITDFGRSVLCVLETLVEWSHNNLPPE